LFFGILNTNLNIGWYPHKERTIATPDSNYKL